MIEDAVAMAARVAPCILSEDFEYPDAAKAIIRGAILRWNDAGTGAITQAGAGSFNQTIDTRQPRKSMFWPSELTDLQGLCNEKSQQAFSVTMATPAAIIHAPGCSLYLGALYCSCGADIAGEPIYG